MSNKWIRILLSITSLCFVCAIVAFGVFASSQLSYNVSGKVKYVAQEVACSLTTRVYYNADYNTIINDLGDEDDGILDSINESLTTTLNIGNKSYSTANTSNYNFPDNDNLPVLTFRDGNSVFTVYRIVIEIVIFKQDGYIKVTPSSAQATSQPTENSKLWFYLDYDEAMTVPALYQVDTTFVVSYYVLLQDLTRDISEEESSFNINIIAQKVDN